MSSELQLCKSSTGEGSEIGFKMTHQQAVSHYKSSQLNYLIFFNVSYSIILPHSGCLRRSEIIKPYETEEIKGKMLKYMIHLSEQLTS